jgi:putative flippase GtrA
MNTFVRWYKFNLVGSLGMLFQLGALSGLNHLAPGHYLVATAAAIELTLLHNFTWHLHFTWPDRRDEDGVWRYLARFHLSNGLVSMAGNLALMRGLVGAARLPVLAANCIAILACSIVNFWLSHTWAFADSSLQATHANAET